MQRCLYVPALKTVGWMTERLVAGHVQESLGGLVVPMEVVVDATQVMEVPNPLIVS